MASLGVTSALTILFMILCMVQLSRSSCDDFDVGGIYTKDVDWFCGTCCFFEYNTGGFSIEIV